MVHKLKQHRRCLICSRTARPRTPIEYQRLEQHIRKDRRVDVGLCTCSSCLGNYLEVQCFAADHPASKVWARSVWSPYELLQALDQVQQIFLND